MLQKILIRSLTQLKIFIIKYLMKASIITTIMQQVNHNLKPLLLAQKYSHPTIQIIGAYNKK